MYGAYVDTIINVKYILGITWISKISIQDRKNPNNKVTCLVSNIKWLIKLLNQEDISNQLSIYKVKESIF